MLIVYNIFHTGVVVKKISCNQVKEIIDSLQFKDGVWFCLDKKSAKNYRVIAFRVYSRIIWSSMELYFNDPRLFTKENFTGLL